MNIIEQAKKKQEDFKKLNTFIHISNDDIDKKAHLEFLEKHNHKDSNFGAIGGHISYNLTRTSIGFFVSISCSHCNESKDITNYDNF